MSARQQAQCTPTCALYRGPMSLQNAAGIEPGVCAPFPAGIPADIWEGRFDHRKAHPDQVGAETWTARVEGVKFPSYALHVPQDPSAATLVADATESAMTGAMIALVPSAADIERLAIPGGEAPEDLHLTLLYLGEASAIGEPWRQQLIDWVTNDLAPTWDYVEAEGFAPAWFNPTGDEPCLVMVCSGGDLAEIYESVLAEVTETVADLPEQHAPWQPHITLLYSDVYEARDVGAGTASDGGTDSGAGSTAGAMSYHHVDSVEASSIGLDSAGSSGQRNSGGGGSHGESLSTAGRGRPSFMPGSEMRGAVSPAYRESSGALEAPRGSTNPGDVLKASGDVQGARHPGLGGLRGVSARGDGEVSRATPGEGAGVSSGRSWSGVTKASGQEVSTDFGPQGASGSVAASKKGALEALGRIADLTGPISFDRIRLAFAGEIFDIPLGSGAEVAPAVAESAETPPPPAAVDVEVAAAGPMREVWDGPLRGL